VNFQTISAIFVSKVVWASESKDDSGRANWDESDEKPKQTQLSETNLGSESDVAAPVRVMMDGKR
jgi:hypothetical protein